MTVLFWLIESAVRVGLLVATVALLLGALRITGADSRLRVWTVVLVAAMVLPFAPTLWSIPLPYASGAPVGILTGSTSEISDAVAQSPAALTLSPVEGLLAIYVAGVLVLLTRLGVGYLWTRRLRASARTVPGQPFAESALVHVPVTVGLLSPTIIVPDTWRTWPDDTVTAVIAHEQAHATRRDGLWSTLAQLHRAFHWCNPLSWWLARHLVSLSECASDDAALRKGITPARYAEILLGFARVVSTGHPRVAWIVPMARPSGRDTERRVDRVLHWKGRPPMTRARLLLLVIVMAIGSAAVYTATLVTDVATPAIPTETVFVPALPPPTATPAPVPDGALPLQQKTADPTVVLPVLVKQVHPKYTAAAMRAKIQGTVTLQVTIDAAGDVTAARVTESLDAEHGLDTNAVDAVMQWKYTPGTIGGTPKAFGVEVKVEFRLH